MQSKAPFESTVLFENQGTLYQYAGEASSRPYYEPLGANDDFTIAIEKRKQTKTSNAAYFIVVAEDGTPVFEQAIGVELQLSFSTAGASVHWAAVIEDALETVAFRFSVAADLAARVTPQMRMQTFVDKFNQCTYSLLTGYDEVDPGDEWYQYLAPAATRELPNETSTEPAFEFDATKMSVKNTGAGNICAAESLQFNRMLVVKRANEADSLELQALTETERGLDRAAAERLIVRSIDPTSTGTLLANGDLQMFVFGGKGAAIQEVDLARGEVVQQYKPRDMDVQRLTYANHTPAGSGSVYTCLSRNVAFNIDTRIDPSKCVVMEDGKEPADYALGSLRKDFTCHATSANGYLAIGDGAGNVRLYSGPPGSRKPAGGYFPKTAKTLLETKTPVVDIDVTSDGKYIVAATAQFLLFIDTKYVDDKKSAETTGFVGRMGKKKPQPVILQPSPEQILRMGGASALRFTGAKFDRFSATNELCVTASCGDFVLTWSLRAIVASQSSGRSVVNSAVSVGGVVLSTSANRSDNVSFLTGSDVGVLPFHEAKKEVSRAWTWGQTK